MSDEFRSKLASLVTLEMAKAKNSPEVVAEMTEAMASSLAFTVAIGAGGDSGRISTLLEGLTQYMYEVAAERAPLAKMILTAKGMAK